MKRQRHVIIASFQKIVCIHFLRTSLLISSFFCNYILFAQQNIDSIKLHQQTAEDTIPGTEGIDLRDVLKKAFNIETPNPVDRNNKIPPKVHLSLLPVAGYTLQTNFAVSVSAGIAFYTDTTYPKKISNILTSITYTAYYQLLFPIAANIWTRKNKYNIALDYRILQYPSTNYGIGTQTTESDAYTLNFNYIKLHQTVLKKVYKDLYAGIGFYYDHFWNIEEVNPPPGVRTSFQRYENKVKEIAVGLAYKLLYDSRHNQINATNGFYAAVTFRPNYTFLGSDNNWKSLLIEYRKYIKLGNRSKNILALWSYNWLTIGKAKPPYLLLPSTGWDDLYNTARGYIQSRFRARNMVYAEAEYRFKISTNGLLGGVIFANAQSFSRTVANQLTVIAPAAGFGLRIKLNKYSNTNLCIDYGFGTNGSKGLFLNLGEVF